MTQKEAEKKVKEMWAQWREKSTPATHPQKYSFYRFLEKSKSEALEFRVGKGQDKWQTVQAWLIEK